MMQRAFNTTLGRRVATYQLRTPSLVRPTVAGLHSSATRRTEGHAGGLQVLHQAPKICTDLHNAKLQKGLTFEQIAKAMGRSEVWVASIFYGQGKPEPSDLKSLNEVLGVPLSSLEDSLGPHFFPGRGLGPMPPTDALMYRLYEIVLIFGWPIKSVIHEKIKGDGIMSAIDCKINVDVVKQDGADRINININGKWLPYSKY